MDENLVGYLLNALDPDTHREVEAYVQGNPDAQHRLELLRRALQPLAADADEEEPPPGLGMRTLGYIARNQCRQAGNAPEAAPTNLDSPAWLSIRAPQPRPSQRLGPGRSWWRRADVLVAAVLLIAVFGTVVSLLPGLWTRQQIYACQNNLRLFHQALMAYSDHHGGAFPKVEADPPRNVAAVFVPILHDSGVLPNEVTVNCPANGARRPAPVSLAQFEALRREQPEEFNRVVHGLAGCYAYPLGYGEPGAHFGLRADDDDHLPILADVPPIVSGRSVGPGNSPNHSGRGQNVLSIDGHVRFSTNHNAGLGGDDIYVNQKGQVAAGCNASDSVLGAGWATPYPEEEH
jgi:hypothetical protein